MEKCSNTCKVRGQKKKSGEQYIENVWKEMEKNSSYFCEREKRLAARRTYFPLQTILCWFDLKNKNTINSTLTKDSTLV